MCSVSVCLRVLLHLLQVLWNVRYHLILSLTLLKLPRTNRGPSLHTPLHLMCHRHCNSTHQHPRTVCYSALCPPTDDVAVASNATAAVHDADVVRGPNWNQPLSWSPLSLWIFSCSTDDTGHHHPLLPLLLLLHPRLD